MAAQKISIRFSGYWSEYNCGLMPYRSGVFCVYRGRFDDRTKVMSVLELLYIGAATDVREHVSEQVLTGRWRETLAPGEILAFNHGPVITSELLPCKMALVMQHRPPQNEPQPEVFPFGALSLRLSGKVPLLSTRVNVAAVTSGAAPRSSAGLLQRGLDFLRGIQPG